MEVVDVAWDASRQQVDSRVVEILKSVSAAALADPGVDSGAKSFAAYMLNWLSTEHNLERLAAQPNEIMIVPSAGELELGPPPFAGGPELDDGHEPSDDPDKQEDEEEGDA